MFGKNITYDTTALKSAPSRTAPAALLPCEALAPLCEVAGARALAELDAAQLQLDGAERIPYAVQSELDAAREATVGQRDVLDVEARV